MNRNPKNFPERVKDVRRQLGLPQEELTHALGVSFATVNRWENEKTVPRSWLSGSLNSFVPYIQSHR